MVHNKENLLKLGKKMTDRIPQKLGLEPLTEQSPEFWGMVNVLDELTTYDLSEATYSEVMVKLVEDGHRVGEPESLEAAKARCREAFMHLDPATKRFLNPQTYPVGLERGLATLRNELALEEAKGSGRRARD